MENANNMRSTDAAQDWHPVQIPVANIVPVLKQNRRRILSWTSAGCVLSIAIALLIPNKFTATASLMPPDQQAFSNPSMLSALSGAGLLGSSLSGGGFLSQRTPGQTAIGILTSRTVQDEIIQKYNLRAVYKSRYQFLARRKLTKNSAFTEDKKSGIITIAVVDHDPVRARDITAEYISELDRMTNQLSTSSAKRERVFLEERLKAVKQELDSSTVALSEFSSKNGTLDIQRQGQTTMEAAAKLQGELIALRTQLSAIQTMYTDQNPEVKNTEARIHELEAQLRSLSGASQTGDVTALKADQLFPSIRKLPILGVTYYDLYRKVTMMDAVYATLSKQYELAKVQEAKEITSIRVLDPPEIPEKKTSPMRTLIVLSCTVLTALLASAWYLAAEFRASRTSGV